MKKIKGIKKIISLGPDELSEWDLSTNCYSKRDEEPYIGKVKADVFLYWYENGGYDGTGFALWRNDGKWAYQHLGHCSCYGPLEDIRTSDNAKFKLRNILTILEKENEPSYRDMSALIDYIKKHYLK